MRTLLSEADISVLCAFPNKQPNTSFLANAQEYPVLEEEFAQNDAFPRYRARRNRLLNKLCESGRFISDNVRRENGRNGFRTGRRRVCRAVNFTKEITVIPRYLSVHSITGRPTSRVLTFLAIEADDMFSLARWSRTVRLTLSVALAEALALWRRALTIAATVARPTPRASPDQTRFWAFLELIRGKNMPKKTAKKKTSQKNVQ